jgi:hypothetical protein
MAKNRDKEDLLEEKEYNFEDDDDLSMELGGFDPDVVDNRKAHIKAISSFRSTIASKKGAGKFAAGLAFATLGKSYSDAYTGLESVANDVSSIFYSAKRDAEPAFKSAKAALKTFTPFTNKILPKGLASRLESALTDNGSGGSSSSNDDNKEDSDVASMLQGIFGAEQAQADAQQKEQIAHTTLDRAINKKQFEHSAGHNSAQTKLLSRVVGYQDTILNAWHKKTLEIQYRQYYATKELLTLTNESTKAQFEQLKDIVYNTALPNEVKVSNNELFANQTKTMLIGSLQKYSRNRLGDIVRKLKIGISNETKDYLSGISDLTSQMGMMQMMSQMPGADIYKMMGEGAADEALAFSSKLLGKKHGANIISALGRVFPNLPDNVAKGANWLDRKKTTIPADIYSRMRESGGLGGWGFLDRIANIDLNQHDQINRRLEYDATTAVPWGVLERRTLIDILPGYLSRILQKESDIYNILSGSDEKSDRIVYSTQTEKFLGMKERHKEVAKNFKGTLSSGINHEIQGIIKQLDPDNTLISPDQRIKLGLFLAREAKKGKFDPAEYADSFSLPSDIDPAIADLFASTYGVEKNGTNLNTGRTKWKHTGNKESSERYSEATKHFKRLGESFGGAQEILNTHYMVGDTDSLRQMGIVNDHGVNDEYIWSLVKALLEKGDYNDYMDDESIGSPQAKAKKKDSLFAKIKRKFTGRKSSSKSTKEDSFEEEKEYKSKKPRAEKKEVQVSFSKDADRIVNSQSRNTDRIISMLEKILEKPTGYISGGSNGESMFHGLGSKISEGSKNLYEKVGGKTSSIRKLLGGLFGLADGTVGLAGSGLGLIGSLLGLLGTGITKGKDFAKSAATWAGGKFTKTMDSLSSKGGAFRTIKAVYKKNTKHIPALSLEGLLNGEYYDKITQKVIKSYDDIRGAVVNRHGETIISAADYLEGLIDEKGKPFIVNTKNNIVDAYTGIKGHGLNGNIQRIKNYANAKSPIARLKSLWEKTHVLKDLCVAGDTVPRILASVMEKGGYIDAATGKVINTIYAIRGAVYDITGPEPKQVLSNEEVKAGVFDALTGKRIRLPRLIMKAIDALSRLNTRIKNTKLVKKVTGLMKKAIRPLAGVYSTVSAGISNVVAEFTDTIVSHDTKVEELLNKIYSHMQEAFPIKDKESKEADREGGTNDIVKKRNSKKKNHGMPDLTSNKPAKESINSTPAEKTEKPEENDDKDEKVDGPSTLTAGVVGATATWLLSKAKSGGIAGGLIRGLAKITAFGAATAAVMAFPETLAALGVAAVGTAAWYGTAELMNFSPLNDMEKLRYLQYGIPIDNSYAVRTIRFFESEIADYVVISKEGRPNFKKTIPEMWTDYASRFNNNPTDQNAFNKFARWVSYRFMPVYIKHVIAARTISSELEYVNNQTAEKRTAFLDMVQFGDAESRLGANPFSEQQSPFGDIPLADNLKLANTLSDMIRAGIRMIDDKTLKNTDNIKPPREILPWEDPSKEKNKDETESESPSTWDNIKNQVGQLADRASNYVSENIYKPATALASQATTSIETGIGKITTAAGNIGKGLLDKAKYAISVLMELGWPAAQAAGIAANISTESGFRPDVVGDGGKAYGIGQWHPDRQAIFQKVFGKSIQGASLAEELQFVDWELKNSEKRAGDKLKNATSPADAGAIVSQFYERPGDTEKEKSVRGALAEKFMASAGGGISPKPSSDTGSPAPVPDSTAAGLDGTKRTNPMPPTAIASATDNAASADTTNASASGTTDTGAGSSTPPVDIAPLHKAITTTADAAAQQRDVSGGILASIDNGIKSLNALIGNQQAPKPNNSSVSANPPPPIKPISPMVDMSVS